MEKKESQEEEKRLLETLEYLKEQNFSKNQNRFFDFRNSANSFVVNTLTNDCFLRCGSFDQIGHLFNARDKAKYSVSSGSEIKLLASFKNSSYLDLGKVLIASLSLSDSASSSAEESPERILILNLCSSASLNKASGEHNSTDFENIIFLVTPLPISPVNKIVASITNSIYLNSGCSFFSFLYMPALTSLASCIASVYVNLDLDTILLNSSKPSCSFSRLIASSLATSLQLIHENFSILAFKSSVIVNDTLTIYNSPLCSLNFLKNSSNFLDSKTPEALRVSNSSKYLTFFSNALLNTSGQFISLRLSNLSFNSFGNEIVIVGIFSTSSLIILRDYVEILENVQIYKSFGLNGEFKNSCMNNSDISIEKITGIGALGFFALDAPFGAALFEKNIVFN